MNVFMTFGTMWTSMIRRLEQPCTRASATKSRAFTPRTSPRTTRAKRAQMITVIAMTMVRSPAPRLTASSSAMRIVGNVRVASTTRMRMRVDAPAEVAGDDADREPDAGRPRAARTRRR